MKSKRPFLPIVFLVVSSVFAEAGDWPQWLGPDRSGVSNETGLLKEWPKSGPKKVWVFKNAGEGYSGFSVVNGSLFTMGTRNDKEILIALNALTGTEIWATPIADILHNRGGDGPRGTPTLDGDRVYALSGNGTLICASVKDGKKLWSKTMEDFGGKNPGWGFSESPLIDGKLLVCTPGLAPGTVAALDKMTGNVVWQSKGFTELAAYTSLVPADINGVHQFVLLTMKTIAGISATDGKLLWKSPWAGRTVVITTPVVKNENVYVTSAYGVGCKLVKIDPGNKAVTVYENKVMKNHYGGVVLVGDYLYGFSEGPGWVCQNFLTGEEVWTSKTLGQGLIAAADGMLYCIEETSANVALIEASPKGWIEHGRFKLDPLTTRPLHYGRHMWTNPVISNGKLYLRDQDVICCYDIKAG